MVHGWCTIGTQWYIVGSPHASVHTAPWIGVARNGRNQNGNVLLLISPCTQNLARKENTSPLSGQISSIPHKLLPSTTPRNVLPGSNLPTPSKVTASASTFASQFSLHSHSPAFRVNLLQCNKPANPQTASFRALLRRPIRPLRKRQSIQAAARAMAPPETPFPRMSPRLAGKPAFRRPSSSDC